MKKKSSKKEYITKADLGEQTQIILSAMDKRFGVVDKRFDGVDERFGVVGKRFNSMEKRLEEVRDELKRDINNVQTLIDGYVKAQEDFRQEFVVMKEELSQIKKIIKEKLGLEIRTI